MRTAVLGGMIGLGLAGAAGASERTAYGAITAGDLSSAESALIAERRIFPDRPELMLNLAAVYAKTGRADEARALYQEVQARRASAMHMPDGATVSSHAVAARGIERLAPVVAAR